MEFSGINYPAPIRDYIYRHRQINMPQASPNLLGRITEGLYRLDSLRIIAEKRFRDFLAERKSSETNHENSHGWSLVRQYRKIGTGFEHHKDPFAPDTIVVKRRFQQFSDGHEEPVDNTYWWISNYRSHKDLPIVFKLAVDEVGPDQYEYYAWALSYSGNTEQQKKYHNRLFQCSLDKKSGLRNECEVWKQGKSLPEKKPTKQKVKAIPFHGPPIPVPEDIKI